MDKGGLGTESDFKSQLISEICAISTAIVACSHSHFRALLKSSFIDWYRLLGVEEDAETDLVRKKYRNLALQLHPDKNKNPKAEFAFKLVSEAYTCLIDQERRRDYDLERRKYFCYDCKKIPYRKLNAEGDSDDLELRKWWKNWKKSKSKRKIHGVREIRDRLKEEGMVIENCLRANVELKKEFRVLDSPECLLGGRRESPVFNPSDYKLSGYPHLRTQSFRKAENSWGMKTGSTMNHHSDGRGRRSDYPTFDIRSEKFLIHSKSVSTRHGY